MREFFWKAGLLYTFAAPWLVVGVWIKGLREHFHSLYIFDIPLLLNVVTVVLLGLCFSSMYFLVRQDEDSQKPSSEN